MMPIRRMLRPSRDCLRFFSASLNRGVATPSTTRPTVYAAQTGSTIRKATSTTTTTAKTGEAGATTAAPTTSKSPASPSAFGTVTKGKLNGLADNVDEDPIGGGEFSQMQSDQIDWSKSYHGLSAEAFSPEVAQVLLNKLEPDDIEIKPDGILYLPEIKYRRILNKAFGPGGWGLAPRGETIITENLVTREYALLAHGRLISVARGEQQFFAPQNIPTATEGCKSNALMRCCKDLGIASELWDPRFIRKFKKDYCVTEFVEHVPTKKKKKLWRRKEDSWDYPYAVAKF